MPVISPPGNDLSAEREAAFHAYARGAPDAIDRVRALLGRAPHDGGLLIAEAVLAQEAGQVEAPDRLRDMLVRAPDWLDGHTALAELLWGRGERESFLRPLEAALRILPRHAGLWMRYMQLLSDAGKPEQAANVARALRKDGDAPALQLLEARYAGLAGAHRRTESLLRSLDPAEPEVLREQARHRLRQGQAEAAVPFLDEARGKSPRDVGLWALTELAWRATGNSRHAWLIDTRAMIASRPVGLSENELGQLSACLRALHRRRWPAIGQSLRGGTQTRGHLAERQDPEIAALFTRLGTILAEHVALLSYQSGDHPLPSGDPRSVRITSAWSIRLEGGGRHVGHIHPSGMLSSALHLVTPALEGEGLLEMGRPPADCTALGLPPLETVRPKPGHLTLFPSFLYHGTTPFRSAERLSVAFDAVYLPSRRPPASGQTVASFPPFPMGQ